MLRYTGYISIFTALVAAPLAMPSLAFSTDSTVRIIKVDPVDDDNDSNYRCSLREAITLANDGVVGSSLGCTVKERGYGANITYRLQLPAMTYTLQGEADENGNLSGDLDVSAIDNVEIIGKGPYKTIIQASESPTSVITDRVFHLTNEDSKPSGDVLLSGMTIRYGNGGTQYAGGGVYANAGTGSALTIHKCTITGNTAKWGGGIAYETSDGFLKIRKSYITDNEVVRFGGGGIRLNATNGVAKIVGSTVARNTSIEEGGGIEHRSTDGHLTISYSRINDNVVLGKDTSTDSGQGGGISHDASDEGSLTIRHSQIKGNVADSSGGGIYDENNDPEEATNIVSLFGVEITENTALKGDGGGIYQQQATFKASFTEIKNNTDEGLDAPDCRGTIKAGYWVHIGDLAGCIIE